MIDQLKSCYDSDDLALLKAFVERNLSSQERTSFAFESGRLTHKGHLAAIIKMALVLKKLTLETTKAASVVVKNNHDDNDSDEDDNDDDDD